MPSHMMMQNVQTLSSVMKRESDLFIDIKK